jgi:hypothetical protein
MTDDPLTPKAQDTLMGLGFFVMGWSILEATIEVAIAKQLRLAPVTGSIVTAGLQFKARATLLKGLLNRDPVKNAEALLILGQIMNRGERNDLIHSVIGWEGDELVFNRRKSDGSFKVKQIRHDRTSIMLLCVEFADLAEDLKRTLDIDDQSHVAYLQRAHKAANKARKSPSPPKSQTTSRLADSHSK